MGSIFSQTISTNPSNCLPRSRLAKVIFIGAENVGKTSILTRFNNDSFNMDIPPTRGADLVRITLPNNHVQNNPRSQPPIETLLIWDCAGAERYWYLVPPFTRDARVVVAVYDVTRQKSFEDVLRKVEIWESSLTRIILVGNKVDLDEKEVESAVVEEVAGRMRYGFAETSARSGVGVKGLFEMIEGFVNGD
ncbi:P-loop containing nucleoside triphosphate hydrolase protein [Aspergillus cavernicola]|uniref:P-loop containing nucleoside triphosphate hydrolase protein n=1 Tax=Aspergillus cavernicola TaxID=176166 RepID=A0ABR4J1K4_9EURO